MFHSGYGYESINSARSALSSLCDTEDGHSVGSHPLVVRFMTGLFNLRPIKPKYSEFWDVSKVLSYLKQLSPIQDLTLKLLTYKLSMLVALTQACRSHSMSLLTLEGVKKDTDSYICIYCDLLKQCRKGKRNPVAVFKKYTLDSRICVFTVLEEYIKRTESLRGLENRLFISYIKPYKYVTSSTISRWLRNVMQLSGINIEKFKSHSIRGAVTSKAKLSGLPIQEILNVAGWSNERTFATFYNKPLESVDQNTFDRAVLE